MGIGRITDALKPQSSTKPLEVVFCKGAVQKVEARRQQSGVSTTKSGK
jgi:hypothetical protein